MTKRRQLVAPAKKKVVMVKAKKKGGLRTVKEHSRVGRRR